MEDTLYYLLIVIGILIVVELLELPDWINRKLRGEKSRKELEEKLNELETRLDKLENKSEK
ncbi:MAG: hypothetical protein K9J16_13870 [Melioribacteraceae bacterium]|nr:hypothetical protein [Melioribacteraceae bacterium]MCF8355591.1 hypothetical protein [Melioribacteraceae bacterium]MCF8395030.1 hypothetical protein [Melioribacteraceae bacterium]MCF8420484.1 hypothetical protein [Melioribacteraceae bacterium]